MWLQRRARVYVCVCAFNIGISACVHGWTDSSSPTMHKFAALKPRAERKRRNSGRQAERGRAWAHLEHGFSHKGGTKEGPKIHHEAAATDATDIKDSVGDGRQQQHTPKAKPALVGSIQFNECTQAQRREGRERDKTSTTHKENTTRLSTSGQVSVRLMYLMDGYRP